MNRYVCHLQHQDAIILNATDDEDAAWLAEAHARMEGTRVSDIECLDRHHYIPEIPDLYEEQQ